ncbi:SGNH/GDSL hydrolase family protein [Streptomyces palmae]|uniref:SGNH/GDSL hydrolase family protein n=1 Tax=Streptomyces palmae TaxID=1701085 RepID=A0A4Z0FS07_9ACTN|nr:SGNH/GDSL hydrolase family protein [Streptomyces palmae]TGA84126.1 SGNH/GDSL hydrolase family protein [Streptomyces palmae]
MRVRRTATRRGCPAAVGPRAGSALRAAAVLVTAGLLLTGCNDVPGGEDHATKRPTKRPGPRWDTHPDSIASVGDSITRGFDACSVLKDCPEVSWSTGTDVDSVAHRLLPDDSANGRVRSWNYAKTGARIEDLPGQLKAAAAHRPELVTVMIGANDACRRSVSDMTPVKEFRTGFASSLATLRRTLPRTQVYVASVPDLQRLWSQGRKNLLGRTVWRLGICPSMLKDSDSMDAAAKERRRAVSERVSAYNTALKQVCAKDRLCRFDPAVHNYRFTTEELSKWDWFHPSKSGQEVLADIAYREITRKDPVG